MLKITIKIMLQNINNQFFVLEHTRLRDVAEIGSRSTG